MQRITWYAVVAVVALVAPIGGQTQTPQTQMPRANVRELATIEGGATGFVSLPSGRVLIYNVVMEGADLNQPRIEDSTFVYDIGSKRRTLLGTNMIATSVSPQGDRLAFVRSSPDRTGDFLWTMPIDPKTGIGTGQAQRVSLQPTRWAVFSPDGKTLAFASESRTDGTRDLVIVPATGGAERVVGSSARLDRLAWSADGRSLNVRSNNPKAVIERFPVVGGQSELLFARTIVTNRNVVGLSPDGGVAFFQGNPDRFFYRTASGLEGELEVAMPPSDSGWGYDLSLSSAMRYTTMTQVRSQKVRVLDLATGKARDLLPGNVSSSAPAWSPDGRKIAVLTGPLSHRDIIVMNADGSGQRRYPQSLHLSAWQANTMQRHWSPDGRFLAFRVDDRRKVAQGQGPDSPPHRIAILDLNSGQTRVLKTSPGDLERADYELTDFVWQSDGKAIRATKRTLAPVGSPSRRVIIEIPLNGTERLLRDISAEFPGVNGVSFISDREVVVTVRTSEWRGTFPADLTRFLVPVDGGAARQLPSAGMVGNGMLVAGNQLLFGWANPRCCEAVITIVSTVGAATRMLRLPFDGHGAVALPDGQHFVNVGKAAGDSVEKLFLVALNGGATRLVGEIPRGRGGLLAPSPDGKLLAYTSEGSVTSRIIEIDFTPALQAIIKR